MPKFRKKPVVIEAIQWCGWRKDYNLLVEFCGRWKIRHLPKTSQIEIQTLEGRMLADEGDWIIKGVKGEVYPCKPDIFEQTYELVDQETLEPIDS